MIEEPCVSRSLSIFINTNVSEKYLYKKTAFSSFLFRPLNPTSNNSTFCILFRNWHNCNFTSKILWRRCLQTTKTELRVVIWDVSKLAFWHHVRVNIGIFQNVLADLSLRNTQLKSAQDESSFNKSVEHRFYVRSRPLIPWTQENQNSSKFSNNLNLGSARSMLSYPVLSSRLFSVHWSPILSFMTKNESKVRKLGELIHLILERLFSNFYFTGLSYSHIHDQETRFSLRWMWIMNAKDAELFRLLYASGFWWLGKIYRFRRAL